GANASLASISAIIGPIMVTQLFSAFSGPGAAVDFPGAPFIAGGLITLLSAGLLVRALRRAAPATEATRQPEAIED
ncbi:MAG TPA: tetracycline resistance MFS efflux pump, partial [Thermoplasmata archaeon]|nr:tetracycline resistance MFS efflux pump [Thermoplasmata archaeon]